MDSYKFICTFLACVSRCGVKPETCVNSFPRPQNEVDGLVIHGQLFVRKHEWNWVVSVIKHFRHNLRQKDFLVLANVAPLAKWEGLTLLPHNNDIRLKLNCPQLMSEWRGECPNGSTKEKYHSKYGGISFFGPLYYVRLSLRTLPKTSNCLHSFSNWVVAKRSYIFYRRPLSKNTSCWVNLGLRSFSPESRHFLTRFISRHARTHDELRDRGTTRSLLWEGIPVSHSYDTLLVVCKVILTQ